MWSPRRQRPSYRTPASYMQDSMDMFNQWNETYTMPWMDSWGQMLESMMDPWMRGPAMYNRSYSRKPMGAYKKQDCGCNDHNNCNCQCCVADADLLIRARAGERRVVPITIENSYRREREIELEMSGWTTAHDKAVNVKSSVLSPIKFVLAPCEEHIIKIAAEIIVQRDSDNTTGENGRIDLDVDTCQVVYADLRIRGCDIRPIRIAVAILPCDCETYHADCQCTCC